MKKFSTKAIVLSRTDFGEADRILTFLTPDHGKVRALAKGVRKPKSKLAGGIELFSVSDISVLVGRGEVATLASSRLYKYYSHIVSQLERSEAAFEVLKTVNRLTEDNPEPEYFGLLNNSLAGLDRLELVPRLTLLWTYCQLLKLAGHAPNLRPDAAAKYNFSSSRMTFVPAATGKFTPNHIKYLRLAFAGTSPEVLSRVRNADGLLDDCLRLVERLLISYTAA